MSVPDLAVTASEASLQAAAEQLAAELHLPLAGANEEYPLLVRCGARGLELIHHPKGQQRCTVRVDFTDARTQYRRRQQQKELLPRAVGCRRGKKPSVIDGTGGLGRDSFILAQAGCRVRVYERQPVIARMLADGLERALLDAETADAAARIQLIVGDMVQELHRSGPELQADAVYLDPMFPLRTKSAKVKKELRILQLLAETERDPEQLLRTALTSCSNRVVVKRPRNAPPLTELAPSYALEGKTIRFDVYLRPDGQDRS